MRTRYSDDQQVVDDVFAAFFDREAGIEKVRAAANLGHDRDLWARLAETGAPGMALPASAGGDAASLLDLAVVVRQHGRHMAPSPLIEHSVAARLLATIGADEMVAPLAAGERIATIALRPAVGGSARLVPAGAVADIVVGFDGESIVVGADEPPGAARPNTSDLPLADRDLSRATTVASGPVATAAWFRARAEWKVLTAVAYTGLAARAIEIGVDYVSDRRQFDVPVGSFQAVQHGLADAATHNEGAILLANRATWALETLRDDGERLASMALLFSAETARHCTDRSLHYHGGYGFAEEYDIQLFYRRAAGWLLQLGEPATEYAWLADQELGPRIHRDVA